VTAKRSPPRRSAVRYPDGLWRCAWCGTDPLYVAYHDREWGVPLRDDPRLFEMLCLEGAQAGLSWITVLRKREHYRRAFAGFDAGKIARFTPARRARLMHDPGIVRNRLKIEAFVLNARAYLKLREQRESLADLVWGFAPRARRRPRYLDELPAATLESEALSRELKRRGFKFVGPTICYAFMQGVGIVDDHQRRCFRAARAR
jgi:DNA-3-methyladenine glycosylase I